jgi:hypothetical protein
MDSEKGSIGIDLPTLFMVSVVADAISSYLSDDDIRFLYGTCKYFRDWSSKKLTRGVDGKKPRLAYTEAQLHTSPQALKLCPAMLARHEVGPVSLEAQCAYGHVETYKFLCNSPQATKYFKPTDNFAEKITTASARGYTKLIEYMTDTFNLAEIPLESSDFINMKIIADSIKKGCENGHLGVVKRLCSVYATQLPKCHRRTYYNLAPSLEKACENQHTDVIMWAHEAHKMPKPIFVLPAYHIVHLLVVACAHNNSKIRDWICKTDINIAEKVKTMQATLTFLTKVCKTGHLDAIKWWHQMFKVTSDNINPETKVEFVHNACINGHLHIIQWMCKVLKLDVKNPNWAEGAVFRACANGHLHIVQWLTHAMFDFGRDNDCDTLKRACIEACRHGHIATAQWLCDITNMTASDFKRLYSRGMPEYGIHRSRPMGAILGIQWASELFALNINKLSSNFFHTILEMHHTIIEEATSKGDLRLIQELWKDFTMVNTYNRIVPMSSSDLVSFRKVILLEACKYGHLHVVQWLYETGTSVGLDDLKPDSDQALTNACTYGHLRMIQDLCTKFGLNVKSMKHENNKIIDTLLAVSCVEGHLHVARWLHVECNFTADDVAAVGYASVAPYMERPHPPIMRWLQMEFKVTPQDVQIQSS